MGPFLIVSKIRISPAFVILKNTFLGTNKCNKRIQIWLVVLYLYVLCAVQVVSTNLLVIFKFIHSLNHFSKRVMCGSPVGITVWENELFSNTKRRSCLYSRRSLNSREGFMKWEHVTVNWFATFQLVPPIDFLKLTHTVYFSLQSSAFKISILTVTEHKYGTAPVTVTFIYIYIHTHTHTHTHTQSVILIKSGERDGHRFDSSHSSLFPVLWIFRTVSYYSHRKEWCLCFVTARYGKYFITAIHYLVYAVSTFDIGHWKVRVSFFAIYIYIYIPMRYAM